MGKKNKGFTLVELLIAIALAGFLLAGAVSIFTFSNRAYVVQDDVVMTQQFVRSALEIMLHEMRMAGYIPTAMQGALDSDEQIREATAVAMTFIADLNADNNPELVRYTLAATTLTRQSWEWSAGSTSWVAQTGAVTLAENITGLSFNYTYADGTQGIPASTQDRANVRAVTVSLTGRTANIDPDYTAPDGTKYHYRTLQTFIKMRNMGL
ncbi:MAG: prepilin-type N-terminal cleavage/methylation domain-containing protein [Deltaproteobacteria bacterium]|nr:prepilin-type N-terminal cleavage/methylation domain-containing protein [Deltaproteobacteria bacterium]MBW2084731.1 prepilin-type N-terminal cleavage/methylation domain-containing protein [Deltaproteobacteria bacterium]